MKLLTLNNPKVQKGTVKGYLTAILHLAPHLRSGFNVCSRASKACIHACLNTSGRGGALTNGTNNIQEARIRRTLLFFNDPRTFFSHLAGDIWKLIDKAEADNLIPAIRLNGTSDLPWERIVPPQFDRSIIRVFDFVQFYDYTKIPERGNLPPNYHLTFSLSEENTEDAMREMDRGLNVAVVFKKVPAEYAGRKVIDGDENDLRFLDPTNVIVGLKAKGRALKDTSGFVK